MPGPQLTLVWDPRRRAARLALGEAEVVELVRHGRPVQVLDLGSAVEDAREAFRREIDLLAPPLLERGAPTEAKSDNVR